MIGPLCQMAIIQKNEKILTLKYSDYLQKQGLDNKWGFPGGTLEDGETLTAGLLREVKEETGLEVEIVELIHTDTFISKVDKSTRPRLFYLCKLKDDDKITLSHEHNEYKWTHSGEFEEVDWIDEDNFKNLLDKIK